MHLYGRQLINEEVHAVEQREALDRLARAYYGCVNHAFDLINNDNPMVDSEFLSTWRPQDPDGTATVEAAKSALWFANEHQNLVALVRAAGDLRIDRTSRRSLPAACSTS